MVLNGVNRVAVGEGELQIDVNVLNLRHVLSEHFDLAIPLKADRASHIITVPFTIRRANKGAIIIKPETGDYDPFDLPPTQLKNLVRGIIWRDEHFDGMAMKDIAVREGLSKAGIQKIVMASFDVLSGI